MLALADVGAEVQRLAEGQPTVDRVTLLLGHKRQHREIDPRYGLRLCAFIGIASGIVDQGRTHGGVPCSSASMIRAVVAA